MVLAIWWYQPALLGRGQVGLSQKDELRPTVFRLLFTLEITRTCNIQGCIVTCWNIMRILFWHTDYLTGWNGPNHKHSVFLQKTMCLSPFNKPLTNAKKFHFSEKASQVSSFWCHKERRRRSHPGLQTTQPGKSLMPSLKQRVKLAEWGRKCWSETVQGQKKRFHFF